ncbi:carbohydrate deacetylase, partial [Enterococcus faecium]
IEVMCDAAYWDQELLNGSRVVNPRTHQVEFLIHSAFAEKVKNDPLIELVTYEDI